MLALANKLSLNTQPIYRFVNKYSIDFDGVDDRIVTDGEVVQYQHATYSFWCKSSETGQNAGVFGHGGLTVGSFNFNYSSNKPSLFLNGSNFYRYWDDTSAQDDGEWHHWVVYVDINDITNCKLYVDGVLQNPSTTVSTGSANPYTESLTIGSDQQVGGNSFEGQIDEFAVYDRELTQAEITRMYNTYYSPNRIANGNFAQIGNEEVTNGDFSQIGSELVTNGDFATDSNWVKQGGWTIANGVATCDGTNLTQLYQTNVLTQNKLYKVTYSITSRTSGGVFAKLGNNILGATNSAVGTYTEYFNFTEANLSFHFRSSNFVGSIDNVSVKEVGQDWTLVGDFQIDDTKAFITSASQYSQCTQQLGSTFLTSGKSYKLEADITTSITNALAYRVTGGAIVPIATSDIVDGKYTAYFTMSSDGYLWFQTTGSYTGLNATIDNVSVKEVGQHWTFGTGWSVEDNQLVSVAGTAAYTSQSGVGVVGRTYKVIADVAEVTAGLTYVYTGQGGTYYTINSAGVYTFSVVWDSISSLGIYKNASFAGKYNSITIQELKHDATNLMLNAGDYQAASDLQNYYRMGDGILDDYPLIADQTNPSLGSNLVEVPSFETTYTSNQWLAFSTPSTLERSTNQAYEGSYSLRIAGSDGQGVQASATQFTGDYTVGNVVKITAYVYPITSPNNAIKTGVNGSDRSFNTLFSGLTLNQWNKVEYYITISTASNNYISFLNSGTGEFYLDTVSAEIIQGNPGYMTNMSASDIILDTPNEPN